MWSWKESSLRRSRSKAIDPRSPLISRRRAFLRPAAILVASKEARAPDASRPVNSVASSTVTAPVRYRPRRPGDRPPRRMGTGLSRTKVSLTADTPTSGSPARYWARSTMCAPRSPSAPDPARSRSSRQVSGDSGSTSQSWR